MFCKEIKINIRFLPEFVIKKSFFTQFVFKSMIISYFEKRKTKQVLINESYQLINES